jgi:phosphate transport system substrate-binding protein
MVLCLSCGVTGEGLSQDSPAPKGDPVLTFKGCSIIRRSFMTEAARAYEKSTGKRILVMGGGATMGIRSTAAGEADLGGSCRPNLPGRFDEERGVLLTQVAWDALVFITHKSNPVDNVTLQQAKGVLLGKLINWRELGGPDKRILPVLRTQTPEHGGKLSGVGYMSRVMLFDDPDIPFVEDALSFRDSAEVEENVEKIAFTFGTTGYSSATKRNVKILQLESVPANKTTIAAGTYPLFRPLYLATKGMPTGEIKEFMDWLLGPDGQRIVSEQGAIALEEGKALKDKFRFWPQGTVITNYQSNP